MYCGQKLKRNNFYYHSFLSIIHNNILTVSYAETVE